jgi:type VI secretion system secreted protein VgrG
VQHLESDFDFINRLMEEEGVFYYFKYEEGGGRFKHKMYMADDQAGFFDDKVVTKLSFRRDHLLRGLHSIETAESAATASWITHDYNYKKPKDLKPIPTASRLDWAAKGTHHYDWPGGYDNMTSGRRLSKMSMEEMEAAAILLEGTGSYLCFTPAARFEIDDPRLTAKERRIAIRSVIHSAWDPYSLDEGGEVSYTQQFTAIPSYQPYRPPCITPPAIIRGPQTAVVIDNVDPEGLGRVKVQFHWDRFASSTCWLRVAQQWAGKSYGAQFIPRIAMEVLVDFIDGDADRPIVTGCIYNGENDHPFKLPDKISQSGWRTTSYKQGGVLQEFIFEDKAGEEEIYTFAGRNYRRKVIKDEEVEIDEELREHIGHDAKIKVDKNAWVEVGETISISGRTDGKLVTNGPLTIESKVMLTLKVGSNTVELSPMGVAINGVIVRINS